MNTKTKKMVMMAMFSAVAFVMVALIRIPIVLFLSYEPKDVIITIAGFLFGPLMALAVSAISSFIEFLTISSTGVIGLIMNVLASCAFACTAAFIYKKDHTMKGAWLGLIGGTLLMTAVMLLWNYLITPLYMGVPREAVVELLVPAILPFNLFKALLNSALTLILYKPVVGALRKISLVEPTSKNAKPTKLGYMLVALVLLITCIIWGMVLKGVI